MSGYLTLRTVFINIKLFTGLWLLLFFSLGAVRIVWYCLSGFSVLPGIFQIDGHNWLVITLRISIWVNCMGLPCVRIGNKLGGYPSCIGSVVCWYMRCKVSFL